ncbi:MAG: general secretion pathway protein GspK [Gammaproteobacteria bacterium]|nr:general secretion pathway protein GspK [Gammaproteobacteria bacterium]
MRKTRPGSTSPSAERGIALITAMVLASLMTAAVVVLATDQYLSGRRINNLLEADRAALMAARLERDAVRLLEKDGALGRQDVTTEEWAVVRLRAEDLGMEAEGGLRDLQGLFNLTNLSPDPAFAGGNAAGAGAVANRLDLDTAEAMDDPPAVLGDEFQTGTSFPPEDAGQFSNEGETQDEGATTPARGATRGGSPTPAAPGEAAERRFRLLFKALDLDETPIQAIIDWVDPDSETRFPNGAEDDYYSRQKPAYRTANRPFASVHELRLVKGMTDEIFERLAPFVVCLPNATPLNVNTAPKEVLMSLGPAVSSSTATVLIRARETQPFMTLDAFRKHPLLQYAQLEAGDLALASDFFELRTTVRSPRFEHTTLSLITRNQNKARRLGREQEVLVLALPDAEP